MITVCTFSDGHGFLPKLDKPFDLLLIAGDNIALPDQSNTIKTVDWYTDVFAPWVRDLPFKDENSKVIFICGNHEVGFQKLQEYNALVAVVNSLSGNRVVYLQNDFYRFYKGNKSLLIFGTPYCKIFGRWAYIKTQEQLKELYSQIPDNCDILLTHDAPYGTSDICYGWQAWGKPLEHIGNEALRDAILEKQPKYCIHGHLHSANHNEELLGDTKVYCVSLVDENYDVVYEPLYLEL